MSWYWLYMLQDKIRKGQSSIISSWAIHWWNVPYFADIFMMKKVHNENKFEILDIMIWYDNLQWPFRITQFLIRIFHRWVYIWNPRHGLLSTWWHHDMETCFALVAFCDGNPLVTGGFLSQRTTNEENWCFLYIITDCWTYIGVFGEFASSLLWCEISNPFLDCPTFKYIFDRILLNKIYRI